MNELQIERLTHFLTNILTNPYTWLFFGFAMSLGYILQYIRRFYPQSWQEAMVKEEACTLEFQKKPEMKLVRKIITIGMLSTIFISYLISFHLLKDLKNPLNTFINIFLSGAMFIAGISIYYESKIKKDKDCNDVIVGYKYLKFPNVILTTIVFCFMILGIFYLIGFII